VPELQPKRKMAAKNTKGAKKASRAVGAGLKPALLALAHRDISQAAQFISDSNTKRTKQEPQLPNLRVLRASFKNTCEGRYAQRRASGAPSYPRKRVSRLIGRRTNLDSRVRGNDESRRGACSGMPTIVMLCRRAQAHGHFVVKLKFLSARQIDKVIVPVNRIEELRR